MMNKDDVEALTLLMKEMNTAQDRIDSLSNRLTSIREEEKELREKLLPDSYQQYRNLRKLIDDRINLIAEKEKDEAQ